MRSRILQLLFAELLALGAFVCGGLALLGGAVTWTGESRHPAILSWVLVLLFAGGAFLLGKTAATRLKQVFVRAS